MLLGVACLSASRTLHGPATVWCDTSRDSASHLIQLPSCRAGRRDASRALAEVSTDGRLCKHFHQMQYVMLMDLSAFTAAQTVPHSRTLSHHILVRTG